MKYKAVFLDWDGTSSNSRFWEHWAISRKHDHDLIQQHLFMGRPDMLTSWMRGEMRAEEIAQFLARQTGLEADELLMELVKSCQEMVFVSPEVPLLVSRLQAAGYRMVIATDNMDTFPRWTVPALGLEELFDDILDSHTLGALKRDRGPGGGSRFFANYLTQAQLGPEECLLIDDSMQTTAAVRDFGLNALHIERGVGLVGALNSLL